VASAPSAAGDARRSRSATPANSPAARPTCGAAGLRRTVLAAGALDLTALGALRVGHVRVQTRGETSGGRLPASRWLGGGEVGAALTVRPRPRSPIAVELGASVGALRGLIRQNIVDGYTPFAEGSTWRRLSLGVTWRARR
jgi:hypothetical protein